MVLVTGSCHPAGEPDDYDGFYLTQKEISQKSHELIGIPVLLEHDNKIQVGKVVGSHVESKTGRLIVDMDIGTDTLEGNRTLRRLKEGVLSGLSLGIDHLIAQRPTWSKIIGKDIREVSVTTDPALHDTDIMYVEPQSEKSLLARKHIELRMDVEQLKKGLYKKQAALFQVLHPGEELPDFESIQNDQSILSLLQAADSMSNQNTAQQAPTQQVPPSETQSASQQKIVSPEELQRQVAENLELKKRYDDQILRLEALEKNPEPFQKWLDQEKAISLAKRKLVTDEYEDICAFAAESFAKTNMVDDANFVELYKDCAQKSPDDAYSMHTVLASVRKRAKNEEELHIREKEIWYQDQKRAQEEARRVEDEWRKKFEDSNRLHELTMNQKNQELQVKSVALGFPPAASYAPAESNFHSRWDTSKTPAGNTPTQEDVPTSTTGPPTIPYGLRSRTYVGPNLKTSPDPLQQQMFRRFTDDMRATPPGIGVMDFKGLVGKQYYTSASVLASDELGTRIVPENIRGSAPPTPI